MIKKIVGGKRELVSLVVLVVIGFAALAVARVASNKNTSSDVRSRAAASETTSLPGFGKALTIKSNRGGVVITADSDLDMLGGNKTGFTLEAWIKPFSTKGTAYVFSKEGPKPGYALILDRGHLEFQIHLLSPSPYAPSETTRVIRSTGILKPNHWYHVAIMRYLGNFYLLVNGQMAAKPIVFGGTSINFYHEPRNKDLIIGATNWPGWKNNKEHNRRPVFVNNFVGQIDEVRLSDVARTGLLNHPPTHPYKPDTVTYGLWHFDNDLRDASGHNHDGWPEIYFTDSNITYQPPVVSPQPSPTPVVSEELTAPKNVRAICFGFGDNKPAEITWSLVPNNENNSFLYAYQVMRRRWGESQWKEVGKWLLPYWVDKSPHQHAGYDYQVRACKDVDCHIYKASTIAKTYCSYSAPKPPASGVWRFWGRVTDTQGRPVAGAKIQFSASNSIYSTNWHFFPSKVTGDDGRYYIYYQGKGYRYFMLRATGKPEYEVVRATPNKQGQLRRYWDTVLFTMVKPGFYTDNNFVLRPR